jgi:hypothetical protein
MGGWKNSQTLDCPILFGRCSIFLIKKRNVSGSKIIVHFTCFYTEIEYFLLRVGSTHYASFMSAFMTNLLPFCDVGLVEKNPPYQP